MRSWVVGYPDMRLSHAQLMKKYDAPDGRMKHWPTYHEFRGLEVGLWLQAEARHRNSELVTKGQIRLQDLAKAMSRSKEAVREKYMMNRADYKEVLRGANYGRGVEPFERRRFISISEPEEDTWILTTKTTIRWEPQGKLFISTGQKFDLGVLEQRGLDKMKELRLEGNKPVLYLDAEADETIVKG